MADTELFDELLLVHLGPHGKLFDFWIWIIDLLIYLLIYRRRCLQVPREQPL